MRKKLEHKYTQSERKRVYRIKKVKLNRPNIPEGKKPRVAVIKNHFKDVYGHYYCPELGGTVTINRAISFNETKNYATERAKSTAVATMVEKLLPVAVKIYEDNPKSKVMQKNFCKMHTLVAGVRGIGYAKIIVGEYSDKEKHDTEYCHYCITHLSIHTLKNKGQK